MLTELDITEEQLEERLEFKSARADMEEVATVKTSPLTKAWKRMNLHAKQRAYRFSQHRFNVVPAGRRGGKTAIGKRRIIEKAIAECEYDNAWYVAAAPTHAQAKRIYWRDLKALTPKRLLRCSPLEGDLIIPLVNGVDIQVMGLDVPERAEGRGPLRHILLDEFGNMRGDAWTAHIRPALAECRGTADFIGAPEGRNHYYDLWRDIGKDTSGEWGGHTWTTEDVLPLYLGEEQARLEIEAAQRDMDALTYDQEFRASFVTFTGRAYYGFETAIHANCSLPYNADGDLLLMFDFNVAPGVAAVGQEHSVSMEGKADATALQRTCIIGEVHIPNNSNTPAVCRKLIADWGKHRGIVRCFGDATGGNDGSAKVAGSDWDLIRNVLGPHFGNRLRFDVPNSNPPERSRVNAVNSRIRAVDGTVKLLVDPKCVNIVKDFEGVVLLEGGSGEIDKKTDERLTHLTDAIGYYVWRKHPVRVAASVSIQY